MKKRVFYLDFIRAISVILILVFHYNVHTVLNNIVSHPILAQNFANFHLGKIGVSLFIIISGASLMYNYNKKLKMKEFYKKRFLSIYPLFWTVYILAFLYLFYNNLSINHYADEWTFIFTIIGFDGYLNPIINNYYILGEWFLGFIVIFYLIFPLLKILFTKYKKMLILGSFVIYFLVVQTYNFDFEIERIILVRIPEFLFGMFFVEKFNKFNLTATVISFLLMIVLLAIPINIPQTYLITLFGISSFIFLANISYFVQTDSVKNIFSFISKYSFSYILTHQITYGIFLPKFSGASLDLIESYLLFIICFIFVNIISIFCYKLSKKLVQLFVKYMGELKKRNISKKQEGFKNGKIIFIAVFLFIFLLNHFTPYIGEDFALMSSDLYNNSTLSDIFNRISLQFTTWNSRIGEQLAIIFLGFPKVIFNILNTIVLIYYSFLLYRFAFFKKIDLNNKKGMIRWLILLSIIICFIPKIGEIFFWLTGSCNYLWPMVLCFILLLEYRDKILQQIVVKKPFLYTIYIVVISFICGMCNENVGAVILIINIVLLLFNKLKLKHKNPLWAYLGVFFLLLGIITLLVQPSTAIRTETYNEMYNITTNGIGLYISRIPNVLLSFFSSYHSIIFIILIIVLISLYINNNRKELVKKKLENKQLKLNIVYLVISMISVGALILSPYVEARAFFFFYSFGFIVIVELIDQMYNTICHNFISFLIIILMLYSGYICFKTSQSYYQFNLEMDSINDKIIEAYYNRKEEVTVSVPTIRDSRIITTRLDYLIYNDTLNKRYLINVHFN